MKAKLLKKIRRNFDVQYIKDNNKIVAASRLENRVLISYIIQESILDMLNYLGYKKLYLKYLIRKIELIKVKRRKLDEQYSHRISQFPSGSIGRRKDKNNQRSAFDD